MQKTRGQTEWVGEGGGGGLAILVAASPTGGGESDPQDFTQIERGRYLPVASDCGSCHTVPGSDRPFAGGRAAQNPRRNLAAPNNPTDPRHGHRAGSRRRVGRGGRAPGRAARAPLTRQNPCWAETK